MGKGKVISVDDPTIILSNKVIKAPKGFQVWSGYIYWVERSKIMNVRDPVTGKIEKKEFILEARLLKVESQATDVSTYPMKLDRKVEFKRKAYKRNAKNIVIIS